MTARRYERIPAWTRGDRLRKARLLTGLNTRDFAETIGVSQKTVNNAEGDTHDVRKIVLNAWSMATGVPVEWLEHGDASGPTPDPGTGMTTTPKADALAQLTRNKRARHAERTTRGYVAAA